MAKRAPSVKWTREHTLIAINLYFKLSFGKMHRLNPVVRDVAAKMGRTANSLAMKLTNFASLDPVLQARGIRGLPGATVQDNAVWNEFHSHLETLGPESEQLMDDLYGINDQQELDFQSTETVTVESSLGNRTYVGPTESTATVRVRRAQQFFRQSILCAYDTCCCVSGINVPCLLIASHIKPWSDFPEERVNPRNGLCLSRLHDAAFDAGLMAIDENFCVILSSELRAHFPQVTLEHTFQRFEQCQITMPNKVCEPASEFLAYHRKHRFRK